MTYLSLTWYFSVWPHLDYEIIVLFPFIPLIIPYFLLLCREIKHEPFFFFAS